MSLEKEYNEGSFEIYPGEAMKLQWRVFAGIERIYMVGDNGRKMELSDSEKETLKCFDDINIITEKNRALEVYSIDGGIGRLAIFPASEDRVKCILSRCRECQNVSASMHYDYNVDNYYVELRTTHGGDPLVVKYFELRVYFLPKRKF